MKRIYGVVGGVVATMVVCSGSAVAQDITVSPTVSASIKKLTPSSAHVKVSWDIACNGEGTDPRYSGDLKLVDVANGQETYLGGVSSASGDTISTVERRAAKRRLRPEIKASCGKFRDGSVFGSETVEAAGAAVVIPAKDRGGGGGGGGGGDGGGGGGGDGDGDGDGGTDPGDPLGPGGCTTQLRGTAGPDDLHGGSGGDLILGLGGGDFLNGRTGHDCLIAGSGSDRLLGKAGRDWLTGGCGPDGL